MKNSIWNQKCKRFFSVALIMMLLIGNITLTTEATATEEVELEQMGDPTTTAGGEYENFKYSLDAKGVLTLSGNGDYFETSSDLDKNSSNYDNSEYHKFKDNNRNSITQRSEERRVGNECSD